MKKLLAVLVVGMLIAADKGDADKKDQDKLQGTWSYVSLVEVDGTKMPEDQIKKMSITFKDDTWTVKEDGKVVVEGTQKLDPSKTPHEIDSVITEGEDKGMKMLGIYELKGDTMKVSFDPQGKNRPKDFTPKEGQFVGVIKRMKK